MAMQGQLEGAKKDVNNAFFKSKYADLASCWDACREALQTNGIAVLQLLGSNDCGVVTLRTELVYGPTGESVHTTLNVPIKDATDPQKLGSAVTYCRRYALCAALGICPDDDDGNAASGKKEPKSDGRLLLTSVSQDMLAQFKGATDAKDTALMKELFKALRGQAVAEPVKTDTLNIWAEAIKGLSK